MKTNIVNVSELCDICIFKSNHHFFLFLLWIPIGFLLFLVRIISIILLFLLLYLKLIKKNNTLYRFAIWILGIRISRNFQMKELIQHINGCVIPTNHISLFDILITADLPNTTIMIGKPIKETCFMVRMLFAFLSQFSSTKFWHVIERRTLVNLLNRWREFPNGTSLYTTPEMTIGNGKGLFSFNSAFVCMGMPVVPMAVKIKLPFGMNPHPLLSNGDKILLRLLMLPSVKFELTFLDKVTRQQESKESFTKKIQSLIAEQLGIKATDITAKDRHYYKKKLLQL